MFLISHPLLAFSMGRPHPTFLSMRCKRKIWVLHFVGRRLAPSLRTCQRFWQTKTCIFYGTKKPEFDTFCRPFCLCCRIVVHSPLIFWNANLPPTKRTTPDNRAGKTTTDPPSPWRTSSRSASFLPPLAASSARATLLGTAPSPTHPRSCPASASASFSSVPGACQNVPGRFVARPRLGRTRSGPFSSVHLSRQPSAHRGAPASFLRGQFHFRFCSSFPFYLKPR